MPRTVYYTVACLASQDCNVCWEAWHNKAWAYQPTELMERIKKHLRDEHSITGQRAKDLLTQMEVKTYEEDGEAGTKRKETGVVPWEDDRGKRQKQETEARDRGNPRSKACPKLGLKVRQRCKTEVPKVTKGESDSSDECDNEEAKVLAALTGAQKSMKRAMECVGEMKDVTESFTSMATAELTTMASAMKMVDSVKSRLNQSDLDW